MSAPSCVQIDRHTLDSHNLESLAQAANALTA